MGKNVTVIKASQRMTVSEAKSVRKLRVAAYCRVSTEQEEQLNSFENQVSYYTAYINSKEDYEMAGIYADEGISGTSTKRRKDFNRMIEDCGRGMIDLIIVKSISRFARNTQDCLFYARKLKNLGIGVFFEKENINTMDGAGELLFTILSSLAQEESRSISENCRWGIRKKFSDGKVHLNAKHFVGYDKDEKGNLVVNEEQAKIVRRIYKDFMDGLNPGTIAKMLNEENIPGCTGEAKWTAGTIWGMLSNEKYMGDSILQKTYTADFLTKRTVKNRGQVTQYYVENSHEAIVDAEFWKIVQLEIERRKAFRDEHGINSIGRYTQELPFSNKVVCGCCNSVLTRRTHTRRNGTYHKAWVCNKRFVKKGVRGCESETIAESIIHEAFIKAWNTLIEKRADYLPKWKEKAKGENPLTAFRAKHMIELTKGKPMKEIDGEVVSKVFAYCVVHSKGAIDVHFLEGTSIKVR